MKKVLLLVMLGGVLAATACKKEKADSTHIPENLPRTSVPAEVQGNWMFGQFSMTEYWSQYPGDYLGNALTFAIAFKFEPNGEYTHYFTSSSVTLGITTYHQSVTKGTVQIDPVTKKITTHPFNAHYKRTKNGHVEEERDLTRSEISSGTTYSYVTGVEASGTNALYLTLAGTAEPLAFLQK